METRGLSGGPDDAIIRSLAAWTQLFGGVNFEVFGRVIDIVEDVDAIFDQSVRDMSAFVGIVGSEHSSDPKSSPATIPSIP